METENTEASGLGKSMLPAAKGLDLIGRKERPMACCPGCIAPTPLISTLAFSHYEFYCLECGGHFGFLSPRAETDTPELHAIYKALEAEWEEHAGTRLIVEGREPQATTEQLAADLTARDWMLERAGKTVIANG